MSELEISNKNNDDDAAERQPLSTEFFKKVRHDVTFSERKFDVNTLPDDMRRVYGHLEEKFGEEYGLIFIFTMRTAVELHRAWNMTLLTMSVLQQIKDKFNMRMTWNLGVLRLIFRVEDGGYELHRKVPYDYDSEFQDIYHRIAMALIEGQINVHEALIYQREAKRGMHTAKSGLFIRNFPGRLILYPGQAATCAVIFFSGAWIDAGIAAVCGLAAGLVEYALSCVGGQATVLLDILVGIVTGLVGGLFFRFMPDGQACLNDPIPDLDGTVSAACIAAPCLPSIYLGTLYWFFYGTAFVIGILEIVAGELATGVTRFVGVAVKTFVLSLGASLGLLIAVAGAFTGEDEGAAGAWHASTCQSDFVVNKWWRIPLYLACSVFVLGQYRLPIVQYWRALIVQLVAYEVQYTVFEKMGQIHVKDHLDTATSNMVGAAAGVIVAGLITLMVDVSGDFYRTRLLQEKSSNNTKLGDFYFRLLSTTNKANYYFGIGRQSDVMKLELKKKLKEMRKELKDPNHPRQQIEFPPNEENALLEAIVGTQDINLWSILMPAVYQLVPGSIIAKLWFSALFFENPFYDKDDERQVSQESVFSNLMVISTSLALGLIIGFALFQVGVFIVGRSFCRKEEKEDNEDNFHITQDYIANKQGMMEGMYTVVHDDNDDPDSMHLQRVEGSRDLCISDAMTHQRMA
mmetsp:Transcript_24792/g.35482  ORF Transcript_24792/g.35482 Transcript_24792/m.35482 type:complete len:687 (-) Transcript_24792:147-2207(-)|eukprot:CAMPEP_0201686762 /NCGR_PEP_ID=MMETSP0578-20130828/1086_1 /ASSEMBLY_ACC=CAM_ASM_000663 /TAXON_ID=267565 /ORGANISM="Skeletonema grethea, Strain CCMP 1804" /LENGTH=686 /DNA_ID=CAMNT_0048170857 /DNA_START=96 /DNA_END=2156 /DNA_ORIENTATION=+